MRLLFSFFLIITCMTAAGQVTFDTIPLDRQLYGRDTSTNLATVVISGEVSDVAVSYQSIQINVTRNSAFYGTYTYPLTYSSGIAPFTFSIPIMAELANYTFKIYGKFGTTLTLVKTVSDVVAGDAIIIQGQSNAEAQMHSGTSNAYLSNYVRVYASGHQLEGNLIANNSWFLGQGDGNQNTNGNTGQWGLKLGRMLVDSVKIPIAVFNGAHGGMEIDFFRAPVDYQTSQSSNYGKMYYRLERTGLRDNVRAVLWSQGERDADTSLATSTEDYKTAFLDLKNSWLADYPNIEQFYIFQTKNGCDKPLENLMQVKEAQRQLASENADITIMSTAAIMHHSDSCHFPFANGYEVFADRIFKVIRRDLYGFPDTNEVHPPMPFSASMIDDTVLIIGTNADNLSVSTLATDFKLYNAGTTTIANIDVLFGDIVITLSDVPPPNASISYLGPYSSPGGFIINSSGLELLCFHQFPLDTTIATDVNTVVTNPIRVYPNPTRESIHINLPSVLVGSTIRLVDYTGKIILSKTITSLRMNLRLPTISGIYLVLVEQPQGLHYVKRVVKL